ncbi:MAG: hypothetical protein VKI63_00990 [Cyanobium sp.]|jgi:hypothetical protein|nr:hypothetical protein [Cyanobium sp.]
MHFWAPEIDPSHPMDCTQPERYAIRRLDNEHYLAVEGQDQRVTEVSDPAAAYLFHTHEAALRAAQALNHTGRGPVDVVKIEWEPVVGG